MHTPTNDSEFSRNRDRLIGNHVGPYEPEVGELPENVNKTRTTTIGVTTADGVFLTEIIDEGVDIRGHKDFDDVL